MKDSLLPREWILSRRALNLIFLSNGFSFATIVPHFPWLQRKLELGDAMTGFALLFPAIGAVSMMLLTGNLIQRFGSRKLILVGGLVMQLCLPLILLMPTLIFLAPVLLLIGGASGMMDISMNAQAARIEHVYDKPIMSSFHAVWSLGTLLGGGLASLLLGLAWTPLEHAGMIACMLFILVIVCGRWLITEEEPSPEKAPLISIPRGPVLVLGLLAFVAMIAEGAATDWSSIFARNELEATPSQAAAVFTVFALMMTLGRFLGDRLVHHWGPDRVLRYACWVGAVGFMARPGLDSLRARRNDRMHAVYSGDRLWALVDYGGGTFSRKSPPDFHPSWAGAGAWTVGFCGNDSRRRSHRLEFNLCTKRTGSHSKSSSCGFHRFRSNDDPWAFSW